MPMPGGGGGTWPMFTYRGAAKGMKTWPCLGLKRPKMPTLCPTATSILGPCLVQIIFYDDSRATFSCLGQIQTLQIRTVSPNIIYPVHGREAKNHTLSSGTSPYRPHMGVPPPPPPSKVPSSHLISKIKSTQLVTRTSLMRFNLGMSSVRISWMAVMLCRVRLFKSRLTLTWG